MVDRIETRSYANKIDLRLQTLITSPYAQQQLQLAGLINHRGQIVASNAYIRSLAQRKCQQQDHEAIAKDILLQTLKIDQNNRRGRRHQFEIATRRAVNSNFDAINKHYRKQSYGRKKSREKSAPGYLSKAENEVKQRTRVTSAHKRILKTENDTEESSDQQNRIESLDKSYVLSLERQTCNLNMSYGLKTTNKTKQINRDEIVVMQQHSTGENVVVFRGLLNEGESFSFKSQRRPTSPLSLAFYAKGFIDSLVNDCCEFKYGRRNQHINEHSKFFVERVRKASPCENCRRKYIQREITPTADGAPSTTIPKEHSPIVLQSLLISTSEPIIENPKLDLAEKSNLNFKEHNGNKKATKYRKHRDTINSTNENDDKDKQATDEQTNKQQFSKVSSHQQITREKAVSVDFGLLAYTLLQERKSPLPKPRMAKKPSNISIIKGNSTRKKTQLIPKENTSATPSQGKEIMQAWVNETDYIHWDPHNSPLSASTIDADTLSQTSVTHVQQRMFPS
ncbi:unnamed protein product [Rotaria socialis]|uniref:DUF4590 domain-containing protein n=1 Tax=Rotaria socialis TaxID=392032 RepID=A0A817UZM4_9BILA|nr:unnamed protein product [Rotaria socialis]